MLKILLMSFTLTLASCGAYAACTNQIINLPDGRSVVCYYCNDGKIVNCFPL
jgi:hypothetical protein